MKPLVPYPSMVREPFDEVVWHSVPFTTGYPAVYYSLYIEQLWVSVLMTYTAKEDSLMTLRDKSIYVFSNKSLEVRLILCPIHRTTVDFHLKPIIFLPTGFQSL